MTDQRRSRIVTDGVLRAPSRAMLRAVGFGDGDFGKPIVGIANAFSTITPCNLGLNTLTARAEAALRQAGTMPQVFGTITVSDGISMGTEGMKYSLVSREVIAGGGGGRNCRRAPGEVTADSVERACRGQTGGGVGAGGGGEKTGRGAMTATARMDTPAIFVYGGTIKPGHLAGQDLTIVSV